MPAPYPDNVAAPAAGGELAEAPAKLETKAPMQMVQLLVDQGVTEVPTKFIQPEHKRAAPLQPAASTPLQIPVIDMAGLDGDKKDEVMAEIAKACEEWGFLQVINHGVPQALMEDTKKVAQEFFALSPEEKEVNAIQPGKTVGYGRLFENSKGVANWVDRITIWSYGEQQKAAEPCMPPKPERASQVIDAYARAILRLSSRIVSVLSATLGLEPHVIGERVNANEIGLRTSFNYYPPCPQPDLVLGFSPHADSSVVTVLQQDENPGLEIAKDGTWVQVPPLAGALVVNIGDQMQIMSNAKYKSVMHRVRANQSVGRYSFPNFFVPTNETVIQPIKELLSETNPPVYRPLTYAEYIAGFHFKPLDGKRHIESFLISNADARPQEP